MSQKPVNNQETKIIKKIINIKPHKKISNRKIYHAPYQTGYRIVPEVMDEEEEFPVFWDRKLSASKRVRVAKISFCRTECYVMPDSDSKRKAKNDQNSFCKLGRMYDDGKDSDIPVYHVRIVIEKVDAASIKAWVARETENLSITDNLILENNQFRINSTEHGTFISTRTNHIASIIQKVLYAKTKRKWYENKSFGLMIHPAITPDEVTDSIGFISEIKIAVNRKH